MTDEPENTIPDDQNDSDSTQHSLLKTNVSGSQLLGLVILLVVVAVGILFLQEAKHWQEDSRRKEVTKHDAPPNGWNEIELGITRSEVAQMFVDQKVTWPSIQKPGMAPTEWASHVNLSVNGHQAKSFSLRFSDGQRWDYGRHPQISDEMVDSETLIGGLDPQAKLIGITWMLDRSDYDLDNESVPIAALEVMGSPHSERQDVTGHGQVYEWDWPSLKAYYTTIDGRLSIQNIDDGDV